MPLHPSPPAPAHTVTIVPPAHLTLPVAPEVEAFRHWRALVAAGLIGTPSATPPDVAANRAATDALFRSFAHPGRRRGIADRLHLEAERRP